MEPKREIILLRVAAMATDALELFQCPSVLRQARLAEGTFERLEARRSARCDALHRLVPAHTGLARRALLDLKRAVHNDRLPSAPPGSSQPSEALAQLDTLRTDLGVWEADLRTYLGALDGGVEALRADWERVQENLARAWSDELLARGVLHAQPELYRELEQLNQVSTASSRPPKKRDQRWELSLLAYAYRAATKTSPFSTLTLTAAGRAAGHVELFPVPEVAELSSLLVLSPELVNALAGRWLTDPEVAARAPLRAPDLVEVDGNHIVYLHADAPGRGKSNVGAIRTIVDSPIAQVALHLIRGAPGPLSLSSFRRLLAGTLGCEEETLSGILRQLHEVGLLRPTLSYDECRPDALEELVKATAELGATAVEPSPVLAATLVEQLRSLAGQPAQKQAAGLTTTLVNLNKLLGDGPEIQPGKAIFDRCGLSSVIDLPAAAIGWVAPRLQQILGVLPLFNVEHGVDRLMQGFFRERCADGVVLPVLKGFAEFQEFVQARFDGDGRDPFTLAAEKSEAASAATTSRQHLIDELRGLISRSPSQALSLPDGFFHRWTDRARPYEPQRTRLSASFLGQFVDTGDAGRPRFVLNGVVSGYGTLAAAWARADDAKHPAGVYLRGLLLEKLHALDPGGDVAEIATALDFGGQVRDRLTPFYLPYPGRASSPDPDRRIDWGALGLALDAQLNRVTLVRRQDLRRVLPLHLGTLSSFHFPAFYRFLMALGPAFTPTFSLVDLIEGELSEAERSTPRHYGRITAEPIILSRETWCMPSHQLPRFDDGPLTFAGFLSLRRWARDFDLPRRVFMTGVQTFDLVREGLDLQSLRRARKPFFVDFDDFSSCALLCRFTRRLGPTVRVAEMLPVPEQNPFRSDQRGRTVECVLEIQGDALQ